MPQSAGAALSEGRAAFERRDWRLAFDELSAADADEPLGPEDLERLGEAARWSRRSAEMFDAFERAAAGYQGAGDACSAARVAVRLTVEHWSRNGDALAAGWLARADRMLEDHPDCRERGMVLMCWAQAAIHGGDAATARGLSEQMVEFGRQLGDRDIEALGRLLLGHSRLLEGEAEGGAALIDEAMAAALGGELELWTTGQIFCSTIFACRNRGDLARAGEWSFASLRWCERQSLSGFPGLCRFHRAEIMRFRGDLDRAERDADEAVEELLATAPRWAAWALHELGEIRRRRGDLAGAGDAFRRSVELGFNSQPGLALLRLDEGKPPAARRAIASALEDDAGLVREGRWLLLPAAVEIGLAAGDAPMARAALSELRALALSLGTEAVDAAAAVAAGRVALADTQAEQAARELRRGIRIWSEIDVPYEAAQGRELLARAYEQLGDPDAATLELTAARACFERIGAEREARRLEVLHPRAGMPATPTVKTFMFTDIVDSTRFVELLGDEQWEPLLAWHDRTLRACFTAQSGTEVKHEGDGFFVAFDDPAAAIECACSIQRALRDHRSDHGFAPQVRIGLHTSSATDRGGDYSGRGVHTTARIAAAGGAGDVLASRATLDALGDDPRVMAERSLTLKGIAEPVRVAAIDWAGSS